MVKLHPMKNILLFCLFLLASVSASAVKNQDYSFRYLDTEKGLSQNTVLSILQDRKGFMWFGTKDGLNRFDGNRVRVFKNEEGNPFSLGNNTVWSLLELPDGSIWTGTEKGIFIFNPETEQFTPFVKKTQAGEQINHWVTDMRRDKSGQIWIAAGRIFCFNPANGVLTVDQKSLAQVWDLNVDNNDVWVSTFHGGVHKYNIRDEQPGEQAQQVYNMGTNTELMSVVIDYNNSHLLIGTFNEGLKIMNKQTGLISPYPLGVPAARELYIRDLGYFSDGNIWIGTQSGLYIHNPVAHQTTHLYHNLNDKYSLSDNAIYSLFEDREGGIWVGTYFGGVCYYPKSYTYFKKDYPVSNENSIIGERVSGICEDVSGHLWIGTEDAGLCRFDPSTYRFDHFPPGIPGKGLSYENVHDIVSDGDLLWVGTFSHGINVYNQKTRSWKYYHREQGPGSIDNNDIFALFKDRKDNIWVGTSSSAFLFNRKTETFIRLKELNHHFVSDIIEDAQGNIWFATYDSGTYCYNPTTGEYTNYAYDASDPESICHYKITCMLVDSKDRLWFASESRGICMFDEQTRRFVRYGMKDGFANDAIYKILEDNDGNLWLSSNAGLTQFNPETKNIRLFTQNNGLPSNQFNYKSGYKDKKGVMYFGTVKGMVSFLPSEFNHNEVIPPVFITNFELLNGNISFENYISNRKPIVLSYKQSSFSIDFSALSYVAPEMNEYMYKMEGLDANWNHIRKAREISYSNLPHGKYVFHVKGSNNDGVWNDAMDSLTIVIEPPFWLSTWAYMGYTLLAVAGLLLFLWYYKQKIDQRNLRKRVLFETQKEKEIYNAKIDFFTNVAHEVRTPLSLIKGPLEYILKHETDQQELRSNLQIMEKNTDRLLALINQLLDFRKTETHGFSLYFVQEDIRELLNSVYIRFRPMAEQRHLRLEIQVPDTPVLADVDKEAVTKVISNLFTNAIKYADSLIRIELTETADNQVLLRATNDGVLIPAELRKKIFEPFFQVNENGNTARSGSGIGLALVQSLVELHKGCVFVDDDVQEMNSFVVLLPQRQENTIILNEQSPVADVSVSAESTPEVRESHRSNKSTVLVVEDNEELRSFIGGKLEKHHTVFKARNGVEACEILQQEIINVVISDIMMPQMDGFELCARIKDNQEFSHIPVILLTAKTNLQNKIEGLELGADAYIEKPLSMEYLQAQIDNLLDNRRKLQEAFTHSPLARTGTIAVNKLDEQFLNRLADIIEKNMANPDFNVDKLAEYMYMSRSSLLRKIKGVSETSPNDFIRIIRLKKAAEILQEGVYKVNEVCFLVGFSSTSYFSKAFLKQFGVLPKDFAKGGKK